MKCNKHVIFFLVLVLAHEVLVLVSKGDLKQYQQDDHCQKLWQLAQDFVWPCIYEVQQAYHVVAWSVTVKFVFHLQWLTTVTTIQKEWNNAVGNPLIVEGVFFIWSWSRYMWSWSCLDVENLLLITSPSPNALLPVRFAWIWYIAFCKITHFYWILFVLCVNWIRYCTNYRLKLMSMTTYLELPE